MEIVEIYQLRIYGQKGFSIYKGLENVKKIDDIFNIVELYQGLLCDTGEVSFSNNACTIEELEERIHQVEHELLVNAIHQVIITNT